MWTVASAGLVLLAPAPAQAQTAYATTSTNLLVRFDVTAPGTFLGSVAVTGLAGGDTLLGIDLRPATGQLIAVTSMSRLYAINADTGVATQIGSDGAFTLSGTAFGFDLNPQVDRVRVVSDADQNLRLNPLNGSLAAVDTALAYAGGDAHAGANPNVTGVAYSNNFANTTATTVYVIDSILDTLAIMNPPNGGTLNTVGALGVNTSAVVGFDISTVAGVNTAYAALQVGGTSGLYTINLATGAASLVGNFPVGVTVTGLALGAPPFRASTDLNGDNRSDIVYRNTSTGQVWRMLMNGGSVTSGAMAYSEPNLSWSIVGDGDFTGDGRADLLWRNASSGQVYVMPFQASGLPGVGGVVFTEPSSAWEIVHTPDLNADGRADLLWWNSVTGQVYAVLLNGTSILAQGFVYTEPDTNWNIVAVAGTAGRQNQLVWKHALTGQVYLMTVDYNGSAFTQTGAVIYSEPNTSWQIIGTPDLNGDGKSDLLWRNVSTGQVYGMLMSGSTITAQAMIHVEPDLSWKIVAFGDYDGDGKSDLLWRNESTGQLYMMRMNGLAIASQGVIYNEPNLAWKVMGPYEYAK